MLGGCGLPAALWLLSVKRNSEGCIDLRARGESGAYYHSPATTILQRLPFSSDYHSPAPAILQRLPFSSAFHSPATTILQRLPLSSACRSPAPATLQRLPFSSDYHSPAPAILQRLPFSSDYHPRIHFLDPHTHSDGAAKSDPHCQMDLYIGPPRPMGGLGTT